MVADEYFVDGMEQVDLLYAVLSHWEPVNEMAPMPSAPSALRPYHAQQLFDMGVRVDPSLAVKFKVRGPHGPVFTDDPNLRADQTGVQEQALRLLKGIDPDMAAELEGLSEAEKATRLAEMQDEAVAAMRLLLKEPKP